MMSILGLMFHENLPGDTFVLNSALGLTACPFLNCGARAPHAAAAGGARGGLYRCIHV
jgi:hypothetical protein